jgi:hypothetical protein
MFPRSGRLQRRFTCHYGVPTRWQNDPLYFPQGSSPYLLRMRSAVPMPSCRCCVVLSALLRGAAGERRDSQGGRLAVFRGICNCSPNKIARGKKTESRFYRRVLSIPGISSENPSAVRFGTRCTHRRYSRLVPRRMGLHPGVFADNDQKPLSRFLVSVVLQTELLLS